MENTKKENVDKVFENFIIEISEYLNKNEKFLLRQVSKNFAEQFENFGINLSLTSKLNDYFNNNLEEKKHKNKNLSITNIADNYNFVQNLTLENLLIDNQILDIIEMIIKNNFNKIRKLNLNNLEYDMQQSILRMHQIVNLLENLDSISIENVGNRDRLFLHMEVNKKELNFMKKIKNLVIDNLHISQIPFILSIFRNIEDLTIKNCSLDEEIKIITKYEFVFLENLNLSCNGISSDAAMESLKFILKKNKSLKKLVLKSLWFYDINLIKDEFKYLNELTTIDLSASKYIFNNLSSLVLFNYLNKIQFIFLNDCRLEDKYFEKICEYLNEDSEIIELNLCRNFLTNLSIGSVIKYNYKFKHLKKLNISFNRNIDNIGFINLIEALRLNLFSNIKILDLRNTSVSLKTSLNTNIIIENIAYGLLNLECLELYFCNFNETDYVNFIKNLFNKIKEHNSSNINYKNGLKIYLKLNKPTNKELFKKVANFTDYLYKDHNILIR